MRRKLILTCRRALLGQDAASVDLQDRNSTPFRATTDLSLLGALSDLFNIQANQFGDH